MIGNFSRIICILALVVSCKRVNEGQGPSAPIFTEKEFQVTTRSGLNLREKPEVGSKSLGLLPIGAFGQILDSEKNLLQIQGRAGYWLKVKSKLGVGWLFSGFVKLIEPGQYEIVSDEYLGLRIVDAKNLWNDGDRKKVKNSVETVGGYVLTRLTYPGDEMAHCLGTKYLDRIEILDNSSKKILYRTPEHEEVISVNQILPGLVITAYRSLCSCGGSTDVFYFLGNKTAKYTNWPTTKTEMACGPDGDYSGTELRSHKDTKTIISQIDRPACDYSSDETIRKPKLKQRLYEIVRLEEGEFTVRIFTEQTLPEKFRTLWQQSVIVNIPYKAKYLANSKFE